MLLIRPEQPADAAAVRAVHLAAFPTAAEADLVDRLRADGAAAVSLVADAAGQIVGHVLFSPMTVDGRPPTANPSAPRASAKLPAAGSATARQGAPRGLGLAPLAVLPEHQRRGIGARLVEAGLQRCRAGCAAFVVVLGEPEYYARFGFLTASKFGLNNEYGAGHEFMVVELVPGGLPSGGGLVRYAPAFAALD